VPQGGATFVLELAQNLIFFSRLCARLRQFIEKDRKNSTTAY